MGNPDFNLCKWICPAICSIAAIITANTFAFWCRSFKFESNAVDVPPSLEPILGDEFALETLHFSPWTQLKTSTSIVIDGSDVTIYTRDECVDWDNDNDMDTKWVFVRAATIITPVLGLIFTCLICCTPCLSEGVAKLWHGMSMCFILVLTLFQGLTFLIYRSNACDRNEVVGDIGNLLRNVTNSSFAFYDEECDWDEGSNSNIVATCCWFLTGVCMLLLGVPKLDVEPEAKEEAEAEEEAPEEAPADKEEDADNEEEGGDKNEEDVKET